MLNEGHDEWSISTSSRGGDRHIPNFLENVVKDVELLLFLDGINEVLSYEGMVEASPILGSRVNFNIRCRVMTSGEMPEMDGGLGVEPGRYMLAI
jgi:hypothetical protein